MAWQCARYHGHEPGWFYELEHHEQVRAVAVWQISMMDDEARRSARSSAQRREMRRRMGR